VDFTCLLLFIPSFRNKKASFQADIRQIGNWLEFGSFPLKIPPENKKIK
jgi:hypothetical protein